MSVYLHDIPLATAQERFKQALEEAGLWRVLGVETIPLDEHALGRVTAEPIWAKTSSPNYHASAMDGFAVRAEDTEGAGPASPVTLFTNPQSTNLPTLAPGASAGVTIYLDTGDPLPDWANAVIPIENIESLDETGALTSDLRHPTSVRIRAAVAPWTHVRPLGEDIVATQLVLPAGHTLRPADLGAVAASGHTDLKVARPPRVAILPTGSELVPIGSELKRGDILEYNSLVLAAQVKAMGAQPTRFPITADNFDAICARLEEAAHDHDLILLNAGSSAGAEDFSAKVVEKLGTLLVHGVAVRPGHPVILGMINRTQVDTYTGTHAQADTQHVTPNSYLLSPNSALIPILGVPGYPVSAALTVDIFVEPLIAHWLGRRPLELPEVEVSLTRKITSPPGDDDYIRVAVGRVGERLLAAPLARGAGVITSLVRADGFLVLPRGEQGAEAGQKVRVRLVRVQSELNKTIFCIGSHDVILDLLAQFLAEYDRRFISSNVGSQGGLIALKRGEAHLAGSHLLDPETGEYNLAALRQYLPDVPVRLVALVHREQGLMVRRGNSKGVKSLGDLIRPEVRFVNRQRGAGTRVLLDYHLNLMGIPASDIRGYNQEEYTHLGVAAAVASGRADCGLGIPAAAQALDLDFLPLFHERYDLVIPSEYAETSLLAPLFDVIGGAPFRNAVSALPGYDVTEMGKLILEK
jgi:putative molybdopterin biosynthesis protein